MEFTQTVLGTRVVYLEDGHYIVVSHGVDNSIELALRSKNHAGVRMSARLTRNEALSLLEYLAVACRDGGGKTLLDDLSALPACEDCPIGGRDNDGRGGTCPRAPLCDQDAAEQTEAMNHEGLTLRQRQAGRHPPR